MRTVVLGEPPREVAELIERRRALGLDTFDEVWEGEYHIGPAAHPHRGYLDDQLAVVVHPLALAAGLVGTGPFNLGSAADYRVPDRGVHRRLPNDTWVSTAAVVIEIVSPDDETYAKLPFYAARSVDEVWVVEPDARALRIFRLESDAYVEATRSEVLDVDTATLTAAIDWP